ncbi:MAG TPA: OsmC family protein [Methanocorpusculum sp.]|nr:OsmC family protein [Methanocorpusculum sp.]HJK01228.1 OsmC family protein [Methanocorpusculum sp.]HJK02136.1 OsmC family protein [Methanocorpusculum sp.]
MLNNIDITQVKKYEDEIKADDNEARFTTKMTGTWQFDETGPQFTADVKTDSGHVTFALTHPNFEKLGNYPSPMAYGLFWICGCASATFMTAATKRGIKIDALHTDIEADLDYHAQFQLGTQPLVGEYRITFHVTSAEATDEEIESLRDAAYNGCMALFTVRNAIPLTVSTQRV